MFHIFDGALVQKSQRLSAINPLQPGFAFLYPWKTKPLGFLVFSGGIEKQHWAVMG